MFGTEKKVGFVVIFLTEDVGFLHASSGRGVVAGGGQAEHGAIAEFDGGLHKAFAEGAAADDRSPVIVLNGTCKDFTGRG